MHGFISYAHKDAAPMGRFRTELQPAWRRAKHWFWTDDKIAPGSDFDSEIKRQIAASDVFILLMSTYFSASDYINKTELPLILRKKTAGTALVLPVLLRDFSGRERFYPGWQYVPSGKSGLLPIRDWRPQDHGYKQAVDQLRLEIDRHAAVARAAKR